MEGTEYRIDHRCREHPGISDPGEELVQMCYEAGVSVTSLPGSGGVRDGADDLGTFHKKICFRGISSNG